MKMKRIQLNKGKEKALNRKHPWVFSGAINLNKSEACAEGDLVRIESASGEFLAIGHHMANTASIRVKLLSFIDEPIDEKWFASKITKAQQLREDVGLLSNEQTNAFRLVFGEGDFLPGLIVDLYNGHAVIQCHTLGMYRSLNFIVSALKEVLGDSLISIFNKSGETLHHSEIENEAIQGDQAEADILENGHTFRVNWVEGQKTGFFIDQRDNRQLVGTFSKGKKVLNAFSYSGGFSIYALNNGAREVHSVDLSESACALANVNAELNNVADRHQSYASDVQQFLKNMDDDYDIVILDPPAFAKRRKAVHNAIQAYKRLNATAMKNMRPNTLLFTFSCSQNVTPQIFTDTIRAAAIETGRDIQILKELRQPADHPENIYFPEGHYLKGLLLRVM